MTEAEWNACTDPRKMLDALRDSGQLSERKARLFAVAVCRRIWPLLTDERGRRAVEVVERFADGLADAEELAGAASDADAASAGTSLPEVAIWHVVRSALFLDAGSSAYYAAFIACCGDKGRPAERRFELLLEAVTAEQGAQCGLLRDIVGGPFRPLPPLDPTWLTPAVMSIARRAYDERDFVALPVLADALEDAGCTDAEILNHLRGEGPHVRGCWAIDLLLGKS
jgi:hypothetical protein